MSYLLAILLFFGVPSLWLTLKRGSLAKGSALYALAFLVPSSIVVNHLGIVDEAWYVPKSVFAFRLLGDVPVEDIIMGFLIPYAVLLAARRKTGPLPHLAVGIAVASAIPFLISPGLVHIPYAFAWLGGLGVVVPACALVASSPRRFLKDLNVIVPFWALLAVFEIVALSSRFWIFGGRHYLGWMPFPIHPIPIEEFVCWIILFPVSILAYHRFFAESRIATSHEKSSG